jgi:hypothetical protein
MPPLWEPMHAVTGLFLVLLFLCKFTWIHFQTTRNCRESSHFPPTKPKAHLYCKPTLLQSLFGTSARWLPSRTRGQFPVPLWTQASLMLALVLFACSCDSCSLLCLLGLSIGFTCASQWVVTQGTPFMSNLCVPLPTNVSILADYLSGFLVSNHPVAYSKTNVQGFAYVTLFAVIRDLLLSVYSMYSFV